jgi:hypothetical protein
MTRAGFSCVEDHIVGIGFGCIFAYMDIRKLLA